MMGWLSSKCACNKKCRRPTLSTFSDSDSKSVSEIELCSANETQSKKSSKSLAKSTDCCKIKRLIPRRVLKWFGQEEDMSMTKIEKSK